MRERTPGIGFLGEEEGFTGSTGPDYGLTWVLDPVDGTVNFVHGLPLCAVPLGLVRRRRPVLGVIEAPFLGTRYHAAEGDGAYADGEPIRASGVATLADAVVAVGDYAVGADAEPANRLRLAVTARLVPRVQRIRMLGTAALDLAWLAHGRLDALVMLANNPWDTPRPAWSWRGRPARWWWTGTGRSTTPGPARRWPAPRPCSTRSSR